MRFFSSLWAALVDGVADMNANRSRSGLQFIGIVLGVGSVVATLGLIDGGRQQTTKFFETTGGILKMRIDNKNVEAAERTATERNSKGLTYRDAEILKRDGKNLSLVEPTIERQELVRRSGFEKRLNLSGATPAYEPMYSFHVADGRFITQQDLSESSKVVVLGSTRRDQLFGGENPIGKTVEMAGATFTVVGVMEKKEFFWNEADGNSLEWMNEMIFVPITTMMNRLSGERENQKVAYINVQVSSLDSIDAGNEEVRTLLKRAHGGIEDFEIYNRKDRMKQMEQQGKVYDVTFMVCGTISLLVGGIVIMNILLASFNERVREVGTRKALGASPLHIAAQFLVESVVVTMAGGVIGIFTGIGFCEAMASLLQQSMSVTPSMMVTGFSCAVVVGIFFGFYPAVRAARLSPVEALRYE